MPHRASEEDFLALVEALCAHKPALSALTAGIVAAIGRDISADSRSFARLFGIGHALVLREISLLTEGDSPLEITRRDPRTQRTYLKLTVKGEALMAEVLDLGLSIAK
jgi:hypothetical protein